ncbi:hypothetical protein Hanom_Chr00s000006g01613111 [Helianthus anomalus]
MNLVIEEKKGCTSGVRRFVSMSFINVVSICYTCPNDDQLRIEAITITNVFFCFLRIM